MRVNEKSLGLEGLGYRFLFRMKFLSLSLSFLLAEKFRDRYSRKMFATSQKNCPRINPGNLHDFLERPRYVPIGWRLLNASCGEVNVGTDRQVADGVFLINWTLEM